MQCGIKQFFERAKKEATNNKSTEPLFKISTTYYGDMLNSMYSIIYLRPIKFRGYENAFPKPLIILEISNKVKNNLNFAIVDVMGRSCPKIYWS